MCPVTSVQTGRCDSSLGFKLGRLFVFPDLSVPDRQLRPKPHLPGVVVQRLVVQRAEDQPLLVVTVINSHPHPLADSSGLVGELDFHMVARFVSRLALALVLLW